jgi:23S rRNA pseudouridine1911/1915/1917 synthase
MPFQFNIYHIKEPTRAFLYLIHELGFSQKDAQRFIAKGRLFVNDEPMTKTTEVIEGEIKLAEFVPSSQGLKAIYENSDFALFDKPSGLLVHPSSRHTPYSLIDEVKYHYGEDANIVHRIDKETSGLLLCARHKKSERTLKMMFESRDVQKEYLALVEGEVKEAFLIDEPIHRHHDQEAVVKVMMEINECGKASQTLIAPLKYYPQQNRTLVSAKPRTGRQHQIRVHLFHVKHPIVGDPLYHVSRETASDFLNRVLSDEDREKESGASRLLLHAKHLSFEYEGEMYELDTHIDFEKECEKVLGTQLK